MSLQHTPLESSQLSADVQRALGGGPAKMMAARGLAPIANPADLITLFYQLVVDPDGNIRAAANKSAGELPENILAAGLADSRLDPRVLDFFSSKVIGKPDLIQIVILNNQAADETIEMIARLGGTREVELVATNEQRLLRYPKIITAMFNNTKSRQSTVDRALELAIHNSVRVPGFPGWDDYCKQILESGKSMSKQNDDAFVYRVLAEGEGAESSSGEIRELSGAEERKLDEESQQWADKNFSTKIRLAIMGTTAEREKAVRDKNKVVALAAVRSPKAKESEASRWAMNASLPMEVITFIADKKEWTKLYSVKLALCQNPKTPIRATARLVPHLRERDLRDLARSKSIPSAVAAQAKKLILQRSSGGKPRR